MRAQERGGERTKKEVRHEDQDAVVDPVPCPPAGECGLCRWLFMGKVPEL